MFQKRICTKIVSLLLVIGCLMSEPVLAEKQKEPEAQTLYSKSCAMVDGDSGRLLYGKEAQTALPNASTTKILTCIVAMEQCKPDGSGHIQRKSGITAEGTSRGEKRRTVLYAGSVVWADAGIL